MPSESLSTPFCPYCGAAIGHTRSCPIKPTGVVGALLALSDLREALATIRHPHPAYAPGTEPTGECHCQAHLDMLEWNLRALSAYLDEP